VKDRLLVIAILAGSLIVGGAVLVHARMTRYQIIMQGVSEGRALRLDRWTGHVDVCIPKSRDEGPSERLSYTCDGLTEP
jgi:hypothetical protein